MSVTTTIAAAAPGLLSGPGGRTLALATILAVAAVGWWITRRRAGTFRAPAHHPHRSVPVDAAPAPRDRPARPDHDHLTTDDLGSPLGARGTFVLFSTAMCATCPQVRRMLTTLTEDEPGLSVAEVDAEHRLDLTRRHGVYRTPTILLLDAVGTVVARTSGPVSRAQATEALPLLDPHARRIHA